MTAFHDLEAHSFPFYMVAYDKDTNEPLYWMCVSGPGAVTFPEKPPGVREVGLFMRFGDGLEIDR